MGEGGTRLATCRKHMRMREAGEPIKPKGGMSAYAYEVMPMPMPMPMRLYAYRETHQLGGTCPLEYLPHRVLGRGHLGEGARCWGQLSLEVTTYRYYVIPREPTSTMIDPRRMHGSCGMHRCLVLASSLIT